MLVVHMDIVGTMTNVPIGTPSLWFDNEFGKVIIDKVGCFRTLGHATDTAFKIPWPTQVQKPSFRVAPPAVTWR